MVANGDNPPIRIIVPVYRDVDATRACLESLAASDLPANCTVAVYDDCSPEPEVSALCAEFCRERGWALTVNAENLGFVATVNIGFDSSASDVILLNSDTRVHGDWVQRLNRCAYADDTTGTVTPFSNDATICSYPVFQAANELPPGWTAAALDGLFARANGGQRQVLPTAVGFCMYIRRDCLEDVGQFDEENFGRGYGEECDFSMRAVKQGWSNQLAADVFVYHQGGASFQSESDDLKAQADSAMVRLHPEWGNLVEDFLIEDSLYPLRKNVDLQRLTERPADVEVVLSEQGRYARAILGRFARAEDLRREETASLLEERESLNAMLESSREQFRATDEALRHADGVVAELRTEYQRQAEELEERRREAIAAADRAQHLEARISLMENSRSWRYTAWLRRGEEDS